MRAFQPTVVAPTGAVTGLRERHKSATTRFCLKKQPGAGSRQQNFNFKELLESQRQSLKLQDQMPNSSTAHATSESKKLGGTATASRSNLRSEALLHVSRSFKTFQNRRSVNMQPLSPAASAVFSPVAASRADHRTLASRTNKPSSQPSFGLSGVTPSLVKAEPVSGGLLLGPGSIVSPKNRQAISQKKMSTCKEPGQERATLATERKRDEEA